MTIVLRILSSQGHGSCREVKFHPFGLSAAVTYEDGTIIIWDLVESEPIQVYREAHRGLPQRFKSSFIKQSSYGSSLYSGWYVVDLWLARQQYFGGSHV